MRPWLRHLGVALACATVLGMLLLLALWASVPWALGTATGGLMAGGAGVLYRLWLARLEDTPTGRMRLRVGWLCRQLRTMQGRAALRRPCYLVLGIRGAGKSTLLQALVGPQGQPLVPPPAPEPHVQLWATPAACYLEVPATLLCAEAAPELRALLRRLHRTPLGRRLRGVLWLQSIAALGQADRAEVPAALRTLTEVLGRRPPVYVVLSHTDAVPGFAALFAGMSPAARAQLWGLALDDADETALAVGHRFDALVDRLRTYAMARLAGPWAAEQRAPIYLFPEAISSLRRALVALVEDAFGTQASALRPRAGGLYLTAVLPPPAGGQPLAPQRLAGADAQAAGGPADAVLPGPQPLALAWETLAQTGQHPLAAAWDVAQEGAGGAAAAAGEAPAPALWAAQAGAPHAAAGPAASTPYFVADLARRVLPHDAGLDILLRRSGLRGLAQRAPLQLALGLGVLVLTGSALVQLGQEASHLGRTLTLLAQPAAAWQAPSMALLSALGHEVDREASRAAGPLRPGLGEGYGQALQQLYVQLVARELVGPVLDADLQAMDEAWQRHAFVGSAPEGDEATTLMAQLRAHLLLTGPRAPHEPGPVGRQAAWLVRALARQLDGAYGAATAAPPGEGQGDMPGAGDGPMAATSSHLRRFVDLLARAPQLALPRRHEAVSRSRALLARRPLPPLLVDALVHDLDGDLEPIVLEDALASPIAALRAEVGVPAALTRPGYLQHARAWLQAQEHDSDAWVVQPTASDARGRRRLAELTRARYFGRYIEAWRAFVAGVRWREPPDTHGAHAMVTAMTRSEPPPLLAVWQLLGRHTQLGELDAPASSEAGETTLARVRRRLEQRPSGGQGPPAARPAQGPADIARAFAPLVAFGVLPPGADPAAKPPLLAYQEALGALQGGVEAFLEAPQEGEALLQQLRRTRAQTLALIGNIAPGEGLRPPLQQLLVAPLDGMTHALARGTRAQLGALWCPAVVRPFERLAGRYPISRLGADAELADLAAFFAPEAGQAWQFYHAHLAQDVLQQVDTFALDTRMGGALRHTYRPELPRHLTRLFGASRALFGGGEHAGLGSAFEARLEMDGGLWEARLQLHGTTLHVPPGGRTSAPVPLQWPAVDPRASSASLMLVGAGGVREQIDFEGAFALWHLLEAGRVHIDRQAHTLTAAFRPGGLAGEVRLVLRLPRQHHVFYLADAAGARGGLFAYLRDPLLRPPRAIAVGAAPCRAEAEAP